MIYYEVVVEYDNYNNTYVYVFMQIFVEVQIFMLYFLYAFYMYVLVFFFLMRMYFWKYLLAGSNPNERESLSWNNSEIAII